MQTLELLLASFATEEEMGQDLPD